MSTYSPMRIHCLTLLLFLASATQLLGDELLVNGSFEMPVITDINKEYSAPSTAITGWSLTDQTVDINRTSTIFGTAHTGDQMVDINGSGPGTLRQSFATTPGRLYQLTLYYANNPNPSFSSPIYQADVMLLGGGTLYDRFLTHAGSTAADMQWNYLSAPFFAKSAATVLQLRSRMQGYNGVVFDSVSVSTVPPQPGDFNGNHIVDAADYTVWRNNFGKDESFLNGAGDGLNGIDLADYDFWKLNYGMSNIPASSGASAFDVVPEPQSVVLLLVAIGVCVRVRGHNPNR